MPTGKPVIDLSGPQGNVFYLMGFVTRHAEDLNLNKDEIINDMTSSDYAHALEVFKKHCGEYVKLIGEE